jgi:hypothetical protein
LVDVAIRTDAKDACIVSADVDDVADCYSAREVKVAVRNRNPLTGRHAPAERVPVYNGESATAPVRREAPDWLTGELLVTTPSSQHEHAVVPGRDKYRCDNH